MRENKKNRNYTRFFVVKLLIISKKNVIIQKYNYNMGELSQKII